MEMSVKGSQLTESMQRAYDPVQTFNQQPNKEDPSQPVR